VKSMTRNIRRYERRRFDRTHLIITEGPKLADQVKQASKYLPGWAMKAGWGFNAPLGGFDQLPSCSRALLFMGRWIEEPVAVNL